MIVQQEREPDSGLFVSDRFFQPAQKQRAHPILWTLLNALLLACLVGGLLRLITTGFAISTPGWFYPAAAGICLFFAALYQSEWIAGHAAAVGAVLLLAYLGLLYAFQEPFLLGLRQLTDLGVSRLNAAYSGSLAPVFGVSGASAVPVFLILASAAAALWLAHAVLHSSSLILTELLVFPAAAALLLFQAAEDAIGLFLLLFGFVLAIAFVRTRRQKRMWGGDNRALVHENRLRFEAIQKRSALIVLALSIALAVPGYFLVQPLLTWSLLPARELSTGVQTEALNRVMKLLPDLTAGQWKLNLETVSGGVQDGSLTGETGYLLEGVEDLRLTVNQKLDDALFLRGYVGVNYENGAWNAAPGYSFDGAAISWKTEGSPRLFIQNLPFLRTAYALNQAASDNADIADVMSRHVAAPVQVYVERLNANPDYTYVPYGAYLNDYYQIEAGDGAVNGQTDQEDRMYFFTRAAMESVLEDWNGIEDTANVLDRVEESYRAFCAVNCAAVPEGLADLQAEIDAVKRENGWHAERDLDEISAWMRRYLAENYHYALDPGPVPEGEDPLAYFLFTSKTGSSVHFASAAVAMYRMFGVAARYVVGYEVSSALFTVQAGGIYTATVQGDSAQAWAEVYVPGIGWSPRDMTPGVVGTLEEVGPGGIRVEAPDEPAPEATDTPADAPMPLTEDDLLIQPDATEPPAEAPNGPTLAQIIQVLLIALIALAALGLAGMLSARICRDLGFSPLRRKTPLQKLLGVFQAVFRRLRRLKLPRDVDSQDEAFVEFLAQQLHARGADAQTARPAITAMYRAVYAGAAVDRQQLRAMRRLLLDLYRPEKRGKKA